MKQKNNTKRNMKTVLHDNLKLLNICFQAAPGYMWMTIINTCRNEIVIFLEFTVGFNFVLESAEYGKPFSHAAIFLLAVLAFAVGGLLFDSLYYQKVQLKAEPVIRARLKKVMYDKAAKLDLKCYDDTSVYNDYVLAVSEAENQLDRVIGLLKTVVEGGTGVLLTGAFFIAVDPVSVIFVAVSFIASLYVGKVQNRFNFRIRNEKNPHERKLSYINRVMYLADYAKEVRLNTELSGEILKDFDDTNEKLLKIDKDNAKKRFGLSFLKSYICRDFITDVLFMIYLVFAAVVLHRISYANVVVLYSRIGRMRRQVSNIADLIPKLEEVSLYAEKIDTFLALEPTVVSVGNCPMPENPRIFELKEVCFAYNEADGDILHNVNMTINALEKTAIVGYNGAGKTTLIKLLMRLYDPTAGEIYLDGVNIKEYPLESYRERIGTVFQDFKIFAATVKENVLLDLPETGEDKNIKTALEKSGFADRLGTLSDGLSTELTTEFDDDGVNLSGGEEQKLAVSRAFYKDADLIILDEPSSALDPIAEYTLNRSMLSAAERKTVVFISHRLSTTRIADTIYMLEKGKVIEYGTHSDLLAAGGQYAEMWRVQAGQYR
jgi:ATP-binding cassette subfamily B protein